MITNETFDKDIPQEEEKHPVCDAYDLDKCFGGIPNTSEFTEVLKTMNELYEKKNHDYGDSFTKLCNEFGLISPITRLSDKLERLKTLAKQTREVEDESVEDTLLDLANYAVMTLVWLKNEKSVRSL